MKRSVLAVPAFAFLALPLLGVLLLWGSASAHAEDEEPESRVWKRLKASDANGDGKITREEFRGPERMWDRMDTDGDGVITRKEADTASERMGGRGGRGVGRGRPGGPARGLTFETLDANKDGEISKEEWAGFRESADKNGDGVLQKAEWDAATGARSANDPAPKVGAPAPKGSAQIRGLTAKVDLAAPKRTTVLIFGSWT